MRAVMERLLEIRPLVSTYVFFLLILYYVSHVFC